MHVTCNQQFVILVQRCWRCKGEHEELKKQAEELVFQLIGWNLIAFMQCFAVWRWKLSALNFSRPKCSTSWRIISRYCKTPLRLIFWFAMCVQQCFIKLDSGTPFSPVHRCVQIWRWSVSDACRRHRCFCASDWLREDSTGKVNWLLLMTVLYCMGCDGSPGTIFGRVHAGGSCEVEGHTWQRCFVLMLCRKIDNVPWQLKRPNMWGHDSWKRYHPFRPSSFIFIYRIDVYWP